MPLYQNVCTEPFTPLKKKKKEILKHLIRAGAMFFPDFFLMVCMSGQILLLTFCQACNQDTLCGF